MKIRVVIDDVTFSSDYLDVRQTGEEYPRWVAGYHHTDLSFRVVAIDATADELVAAQRSGIEFALVEATDG